MSSQSFFSTSGVSVKVANLRKKYQTAAEEIEALSGVDWAVEEGAAAAIIGPSGCGKGWTVLLVVRLLSMVKI